MNTLVARGIPVWLRLGRVSNLPTVVSNVLAASILGTLGQGAAEFPAPGSVLLLMLAMSLFYVGGMYLNDAFDRGIDARERPQRPIPSGQAQAVTVFATGFAMLGAACVLVAQIGNRYSLFFAVVLAANIILYNVWHKGNPCSPLIMGTCRALLYLCVGSAFSAAPGPILILGAGLMLAHILGLTQAAKRESLNELGSWWPLLMLALPPLSYALLAFTPLSIKWIDAVPRSSTWQSLSLQLALLTFLLAADVRALRLLMKRSKANAVGQAVAQLIAASSLLDGLAIAACLPDRFLLAILTCVAAYFATRLLQTIIPGT